MDKIASDSKEELAAIKYQQLQLVKEAIQIENAELIRSMLTKLNLPNLLRLFDGTNSTVELREAFDVVRRYFHFDEPKQNSSASNVSDDSVTTIIQAEERMKPHLDSLNWDAAIRFLDNHTECESSKDLAKSLVSYRKANLFETDERFDDASESYEQSHAQGGNAPRIMFKRSTGRALKLIAKHSNEDDAVFNFWSDFLTTCENMSLITKEHSSRLLPSRSMGADSNLLAKFPKRLLEFIDDTSTNKWFDEKKCAMAISVCASLDPKMRSALSRVALADLEQNRLLRACSIDFCLGRFDRFFSEIIKILDSSSSLRLLTRHGSRRMLCPALVTHICKQHRQPSREAQSLNGLKTVSSLCLNQGLIDEALASFSSSSQRDSPEIQRMIDLLERSIEDRFSDFGDDTNAHIKPTTISLIQETLSEENDGTLITNVIVVVILSLTLHLYKLEVEDNQLAESVLHLETMFDGLAKLFNDISFDTSESLLKATNSLIVAVKSRLELFVDNETIRDCFKKVVVTTAERCMIESRYKSAAMLYGQIDDNVSAMKSLMRTGDIDTVINFALLVRDVTVNRITINYLRHLEADHKILENFIERTRNMTS